ncbi:amidohydrolase family protein [Muricauda ruestringensis]|uniref:Amidohydrolase family protein n=1 Tax=Flagellimonas aurea TaxID=2915619 RepID=A0ABS3G3Z4_9FLAO|nr:amidohydrolase family protein [Allomuricauda aurea]MBC73169.1 amidohydrolase [Allomuricauda sp.]MBO0354138.1 amidohydrolase family protein [Allomuricauda aurea]|tara:strand:- start:3865 stop:5910 length:2046 start_codon:yes stop_codon:yes gene_type:complete
MKLRLILAGLIILAGYSCKTEPTSSLADYQGEENYSVIMGETKVGYLKAETSGDTINIDYDYKNNGRGPTMKETIVLNTEGYPISWSVTGNTTFGNAVDEKFSLEGNEASWTDATGSGNASVEAAQLYVNQFGSPYSAVLAARLLMKAPENTLPVLPAGNLTLTKMEDLTVQNLSGEGEMTLTTYAISGAEMNPSYFIMDDSNRFFAYISPRYIVVREGYEAEEKELRELAENYSAERYEKLQKEYANNYDKKVRIKNVKVFDPKSLSLTEPVSIVVEGEKITAIEAADATGEGEVVIEGNGGTLVPGLYEMHAHTGDNGALLNILAGVTSFRDMGNNNEVLSKLVEKIESGVLAGPRVTRMGFIEGKSEYNANNGILVASEEEALAAVDKYDSLGFYGVKLYNSMNGDWAPAIVKKAHDQGLFVAGHVPAFSNANAMLRAGFDEMTHINQTMLGWVLEPEEDTRTLLRLTAMKRFPELDLNSDKVQETLDLFVANETAMDPTLSIHERLMLSRNGEVTPGALDYVENMPPNEQRSLKVALAQIADDEEDKAYLEAYDKIVETLKMMKDKGILIVPGTDLGGAFNLHRELELYTEQLGYTPAEVLKLASYDMAEYLGHDSLGSIEEGKLADFFLVPGNPVEDIKAIKTISMVSRGGTFYYPSEVYPAFGITPFTEKPEVKE